MFQLSLWKSGFFESQDHYGMSPNGDANAMRPVDSNDERRQDNKLGVLSKHMDLVFEEMLQEFMDP